MDHDETRDARRRPDADLLAEWWRLRALSDQISRELVRIEEEVLDILEL